MNRRGIIFILSSPSGGGKSTLLAMVLKNVPGLTDSVSYTTRPPRPGERDGVDYHFLSQDDFSSRMERDFFAESAEVHGYLYGTGRRDLDAIIAGGGDAIMDIDVQGARNLKNAYPEAVMVFILPPSMAELRRRLLSRGTEDESSVELRLRRAKAEMAEIDIYDYLVINRDLESSLAAVQAIIAAERSRRRRFNTRSLINGIMSQNGAVC